MATSSARWLPLKKPKESKNYDTPDIRPVPENIEDEDYLNGVAYPAHETWPD